MVIIVSFGGATAARAEDPEQLVRPREIPDVGAVPFPAEQLIEPPRRADEEARAILRELRIRIDAGEYQRARELARQRGTEFPQRPAIGSALRAFAATPDRELLRTFEALERVFGDRAAGGEARPEAPAAPTHD